MDSKNKSTFLFSKEYSKEQFIYDHQKIKNIKNSIEENTSRSIFIDTNRAVELHDKWKIPVNCHTDISTHELNKIFKQFKCNIEINDSGDGNYILYMVINKCNNKNHMFFSNYNVFILIINFIVLFLSIIYIYYIIFYHYQLFNF